MTFFIKNYTWKNQKIHDFKLISSVNYILLKIIFDKMRCTHSDFGRGELLSITDKIFFQKSPIYFEDFSEKNFKGTEFIFFILKICPVF